MDLMEIKFESIAFDRYTNFSSFRARSTLLVQPMYRLMVSLLFSFRIHLYFKKGIYTIVLLASFPEPFSIIFIYLTEKINA